MEWLMGVWTNGFGCCEQLTDGKASEKLVKDVEACEKAVAEAMTDVHCPVHRGLL